jgi:outer membrane protein
VKNRIFLIYITAGLALSGINCRSGQSQSIEPLSLQKAIDMALQNNHLLNIKKLQVDEKQSKVTESKIKAFPSLIASSVYQYNYNLGVLNIPQGSFGALPLSPQTSIPLPGEDLSFELSEHNNVNAGVTFYQPISQLGKIIAGVDVSKTDVRIAEQERIKASLQLQQAVEKLYYGLLINQKQKEEAEVKLELAKLKLHDVESAVISGKTIDVNKASLQAGIADEEQNLLKITIQAEDYTAELKNITGLKTSNFILEDVEFNLELIPMPDSFKTTAVNQNVDLRIAGLNQIKAEQARKAAKFSYLPDLGLMAGYAYQTGNSIYPEHNPFIGASFKWNLQDIFSNRQLVNQRNSQLQQSREYVLNTEQQINSDIEKACRKIIHAEALIAAAQKAVAYRSEELKIQQNKQASGLNTASDLLSTKALLARSQADLLAARMNYRIALADLKILAGE